MKKILIFLTVAIFLFSCETSFEVNADWKELMLVHGVLDQSQSEQFIRINKAFLGEQDALVMASISDSSNYNPSDLVVRLIKMRKTTSSSINYELLDSIDFVDTIIPKDNGQFYTDNNIIYKTSDTNFLSENREYMLKIINTKTNNFVTSKTRIIDNINVTTSFPSFFRLGFYNGGELTSTSINWSHSNNAQIYQLQMLVRYRNDSAGIAVNVQEFEWVLPLQSFDGNQEVSQLISGQQFFSKLEIEINNNINNGENPDYERKVIGVDIQIAAATQDLYTYMQINKPQSGISQQRPTFTNIDNGIGIFTSRCNHYIDNLQLSEATHQGLSILLSDLNFVP
tara:strand:+ start:652 stop:1671 length:1020 start_codon:yes stop_codon:yes gene_type:complete